MTTYLGKSCSFCLPRVPFVNCRQFSYFPFGFEGRIWDLIVSVPDHCLSFYWKKRTSIPPVESRQRLYTFLFLSQDSDTVEPTSKSYLPGRVARHLQDSGCEDRSLKIELI